MGNWYRDGTVSIETGSRVLTGTLTVFEVFVRPGDAISFNGGSKWYEVASVDSNTTLTLGSDFEETTIVDGAYAINLTSYRHQVPSDILETVRQLLARQTDVITSTGKPSDSIGADNSLAFDPSTETLYRKSSGVWDDGISFGGVTNYNDLTGKPTLGTAAAEDVESFATAAQGAKADSAVQPDDLGIAPYTGQVATGCQVPSDFATSNKQLMSRSRHLARDKITSLNLVFANWYVDGTSLAESGSGASASITASVEYPAGVFTQVKFSGSATGIIPDASNLVSDAVEILIPDGAEFFVRAYWSSSVGIIYDLFADVANGEGLQVAASGLSDLTMGGEVLDGGARTGGAKYAPVAIIATTDRPSVLIIGDSRAYGGGNGVLFDDNSVIGYLQRPLAQSVAFISAARTSDELNSFVASHTLRTALSSFVSHVIIQDGINDVIQGRTSTQMLSDLASIVGYFPDKKIWVATIEPTPTSTDNFATLTNQTVAASDGERTAYNDAVRSGISETHGFFDIADILESSRNSGKYKVTGVAGAYTTSGNHPNPAGEILVQNSGVVDARQFFPAGDSLPRPATPEEADAGVSGDAFVSPSVLASRLAKGLGRNRVINPMGQFIQAGVGSKTDGSYAGFDQWYCLTQTAAVTTSQLTDVEDGMPFAMRTSQAQSTAQRFGTAQVFESIFSKDMRSKTVSLGARIRCSSAAVIRFAILSWTGTADSPTKDVVNDWTSADFSAGNFFLSSNLTVVATGSRRLTANTFTNVHLIGTFGASLNNAIVVFWTDAAAAQNLTLDVSHVWFGVGRRPPTIFDPPSPVDDFIACQRYYWVYDGRVAGAFFGTGGNTSTTNARCVVPITTNLRATPIVSFSAASDFQVSSGGLGFSASAIASNALDRYYIEVDITCTGLTSGAVAFAKTGTTTAKIIADARL